MPFTPFHLGFALFVWVLFFCLDPIALLIGSIIIDLEPIFFLLFNKGSLHGIMHSILGVIVFLIPTSLISWGTYKLFNLEKYIRKYNPFISLFSSFLGLLSHIFFDAVIYSEIMLFYPFSKQNGIIFGLWSTEIDYLILTIMLVSGIVLLIPRFLMEKKKSTKNNSELENKKS